MRKIVMHPAKKQTINFEQLAQLREIKQWLTENLNKQEN